MEPAAISPLLALLRDGAMVVAADVPEPAGQAQWSFADLLFHARSRAGRNLGGFGGTYHREGVAEPLPAVKPPQAVAVALPKPDLQALRASDPPFADVVERRRSIRAHDDTRPITVAQLGELLYRTARVRGVMHDGHQELASRPYPAGGACYELELYPLVNLCAGVPPALYHYEPSEHALEQVADTRAADDPAARVQPDHGGDGHAATGRAADHRALWPRDVEVRVDGVRAGAQARRRALTRRCT